MVFSSIPFLFFFMPLFFVLYYLVPFRAKNRVILIFSLIFYAWGEPKCLPLMLLTAFIDFSHVKLSLRLPKGHNIKKVLFLCAITADLLLLGFFKYADFLTGIVNSISGLSIEPLGIPLPVGISFFTFQSMSYSMDYYKGDTDPEGSYLDYLTYVSMFPQLVAGPIVRFSDVRERLHERAVTKEGFNLGLTRFCTGLFKKVLLANQLGKLWDAVLSSNVSGSGFSASLAWLGALSFTLQLYFDFSAYSDMAIGMGQMMGFNFPENFRHPLSADSITDFWRKWHISLSTWFRDYVYIPLGGNRCSKIKHIRNMFVVWFLTGLWHGAAWNFIFWGLWHGLFLALEKYIWGKALSKAPAILRHLYALVTVVAGFAIFAIDDISTLGGYLKAMLGVGVPLLSHGTFWYGENFLPVILIALIASFPMPERITKSRVLRLISPALTVILFILSTAFLVSDSYNPFLYFRF